jgi:uncharacterized protein (DUF1697 family)
VATHVALLRGINVGGPGRRVAMADLRRVVSGLGHSEVSTYIQTGNVLFSPAGPDTVTLAADLEREIADELGVTADVVVISCEDLGRAVAANPYPHERDPRFVHLVFRRQDPDAALLREVQEAVAASRRVGSRDTAQFVGRTLYLHTPDGFGRSDLAARLTKVGPWPAGTARNLATVTRLLDLCRGGAG